MKISTTDFLKLVSGPLIPTLCYSKTGTESVTREWSRCDMHTVQWNISNQTVMSLTFTRRLWQWSFQHSTGAFPLSLFGPIFMQLYSPLTVCTHFLNCTRLICILHFVLYDLSILFFLHITVLNMFMFLRFFLSKF